MLEETFLLEQKRIYRCSRVIFTKENCLLHGGGKKKKRVLLTRKISLLLGHVEQLYSSPAPSKDW